MAMTKILSAFTTTGISFMLLLLFSSCKKNDASDGQASLKQDTIVVQSISNSAGNVDASRKGWIDLYDGIAYTQSQAALNSSSIDFSYNYHGGGCSTCRFFESMKSMSGRTGDVVSFSTITISSMINAEWHDSVTAADFGSIKTGADIDALFTKKKIVIWNGGDDVTDRNSDVAKGKIFAFTDKNGKKGFFRISDYIANVPDGDPATLTLYVKIQK